MCGLCGEIRFDGRAVSVGDLTAMGDLLHHRGPDASGTYVSPTAETGLSFKRLKIVDLSDAGNQPMPNEDAMVQVVFNGEIYNHQELRRSLIANGHRFRSSSDTEVIAHLYEECGERFVDRLDGMFAIAVWDQRSRRLVLARDRAGKKPLFYWHTGQRLLFASEIKAFFGASGQLLEIDRHAVPYYFLHGYVPCPGTFYKSVRQLEPGTTVSVTGDGAMFFRRYWSLEFPSRDVQHEPTTKAGDARNAVRQLVTSAVERRLEADVPLGAFLSGGLDSTIVVGLMARLTGRPVKTFSIGFKDSPGYDETHYARIAATRFGTEHTEFIVEPVAFDLAEKLVWHHDGPFADSSAVPTYIVSQLTRQQVTVVLTGDGGDELFAGYSRFYAAVAAERTPLMMRRALRAVSGRIPSGGSSRDLSSRLRRYASTAALPLAERLTRWSGVFYDELDDLLAPDFRRSIGPVNPLHYIDRFADQLDGRSTLAQILLINFNTYLLDDLLVKTDRCTMANSLEARSPFLDTALVEYAARLPDSTKLGRGKTKIILREAFADLVPDEIQRRGKMGFGAPFGAWFRGALREPLHDLLTSPSARCTEFLSPSYVRDLVMRHDKHQADLGLPLWTILCFEIWLRALPTWSNLRTQPESL